MKDTGFDIDICDHAAEVSPYIDGELTADRLSFFESHMDVCSFCKDRLNEQKMFLGHLNASIGKDISFDIPQDFAKHVAIKAEHNVGGLRRSSERLSSAAFIVISLLIGAFCLGSDSAGFSAGIIKLFDQVSTFALLVIRMIYALVLSVNVILRTMLGDIDHPVVYGISLLCFSLIALLAVSYVLAGSRKAW